MPITEEKAIAILEELIRKPETKAEDVPRIWSEIIGVYNKTFAPAEEPKKKRRKRPANPNIGWPAGISRAEYNSWKAYQASKGITENVNPQEYKRQRDAGTVPVWAAIAPPLPGKEAAPKAKAEVKPKTAAAKGKKAGK